MHYYAHGFSFIALSVGDALQNLDFCFGKVKLRGLNYGLRCDAAELQL